MEVSPNGLVEQRCSQNRKIILLFSWTWFLKDADNISQFSPHNTLATLPRDPRGSVEVPTEVGGQSQGCLDVFQT